MKAFSEPLNSSHIKADFSCGKELLDRYLHEQAGQDIKRKLAACFVVQDEANNMIKGYYTLSNSSIPLDGIPGELQKKLPRTYKAIPATLLGRLAVDKRYHGQALGKLLLIDAFKRSSEMSEAIGSFAVVVDPLDPDAERFYEKYGIIKLPDSGKMFLPMRTINQLFQ